jgi:hypothetical protein
MTNGKAYNDLEMGHLLESHLLEKTARHQNLDCSTLFEQMPKIYDNMKLLENKKVSFWADASFRPKWTTAQIATAQQKH